jgi:hypothetical protein
MIIRICLLVCYVVYFGRFTISLTFPMNILLLCQYLNYRGDSPGESGWLSRYSYLLKAERPRGQISSLGRVKDFIFQTDSGVHPTSYPMDIGVSFPGSKAAGA